VPAIERAAVALAANPQKSDRAIAAELGIGHATVSRARATVSRETVDERVGLDGKVRKLPAKVTAMPSPSREKPALRAAKRRIAELETERKQLRRALHKSELERISLHNENKKLRDEIATLKLVAKEATTIAVKATGGTVGEAMP